jgi:peptidoglycan/xylan/chitin deacetylase (PgdA/CDA1 family)
MIFTSSWDDGNELDIKLSKILSEFDVKGTFYIPINFKMRSLSEKDIRKLSKNFEIGSHSFSHPVMTKLEQKEIFAEASKSKSILESIIKKKIRCFAYPFGICNVKVARIIGSAGYSYGRTADELRTEMPENLLKSGFTISVSNTPRLLFLRQGNLLSNLKSNFRWERVAKNLLSSALRKNSVFHLQGHSWEIEKEGNWDSLVEFIESVSRLRNIEFMTNQELAAYCLNNTG